MAERILFQVDGSGNGVPVDIIMREKIVNRMLGLVSKSVSVFVQLDQGSLAEVVGMRFNLNAAGIGVPTASTIETQLNSSLRSTARNKTVNITFTVV